MRPCRRGINLRARLTLPATKGNLLKIRDEHLLAIEAVTFLEGKTGPAVGGVAAALQGQAATFRRRVEQALKGAYGHLVESLLSLGGEAVARAALGVRLDARVLKDRGFLGMAMPVVDFKPGDHRPHISFGGTVSAVDECQLAIREALGAIAELAEVEAILWQLAEELKRTISDQRLELHDHPHLPGDHPLSGRGPGRAGT